MAILIVDDAVFMRIALKNILVKDCGIDSSDIHEAGNGVAALEKYCEIKPELVFLDTHMPDVSGLKVLKALTKIDPNAKVVVCMLADKQEEMPGFTDAGARGYVKKPPQPQQIVRAVEQVTGRKTQKAQPPHAATPSAKSKRDSASVQPVPVVEAASAEEQMRLLKGEINTLKEEVLALKQLFENLGTGGEAESLRQDILALGQLFEDSAKR